MNFKILDKISQFFSISQRGDKQAMEELRHRRHGNGRYQPYQSARQSRASLNVNLSVDGGCGATQWQRDRNP